MKTFRLIGMALIAIVMCANFTSCSDDDDDSFPKADYYIKISNHKDPHQIEVHPGETAHIKDDGGNHRISVIDANDESSLLILERNIDIYINGEVKIFREFDSGYPWIEFMPLHPAKCEFVLYDLDSNEEYLFNIIIDGIDVKETLKIGQITHDVLAVDGTIKKKGPFLELRTINGGSEEFCTFERFRIESFGRDRETCYPSSADVNWEDKHKIQSDGYIFQYCSYDGKITITNVDYWFYKFTYGGTTHEVRKYEDSEECLWDGEWDK